MNSAIPESEYNRQWPSYPDFIKYNPGARHRRRMMLQLMRNLNFESCLDVGCGNGELLSLLRFHWPRIKFTGVDLSSVVVETNAKRFKDIDFFTLNIEESRLNQKFDLIVCSEVIEHLNRFSVGLENVASMVKSGGHLVLTCPTGRVFPTERYFGHTVHPTPNQIKDELGRLGMSIKNLWNWGWPTYTLLKRATNLNPEWALNNFANGQYNKRKKLVSNFLYYTNFFNLRSPLGCQLIVLAEKK